MYIGSRGREKTKLTIFVLFLLLSVAVGMACAQDHPASATLPAPQTASPQNTESAAPPTSQAVGSAPLRVMVDKSLLIKLQVNSPDERLKRVSVTDDSIADAIVISPTQILVHGRSAGEVSLLIWDQLERSRSYDLRVDVDVSACAEEEHRIFPDEEINVTSSRSAIVLSGHVSTDDVSKRAALIASAYSKNVVNVLTSGPVGAQEILLEVKFAEVDRSAVTQLGANFFVPQAGNTVGTVTTGQFGGFQVATTNTNTSTTANGTTTTSTGNSPPTINVNNALNLFLFRTDLNFGAVIQALQTKNLLQILAEPNLIAVNGKQASFLAGGEFPYPIVQPGQGFTAVTISFREFGVKLQFTPTIMPNGNIYLHVQPEVSALDFANALTISGFTIPALSTRKADTEFELRDGQSFMIAGLLDNRVTDVMNKIPGIGDIPILGNLFKSKSLQKSNSELMVLCTVHRISPTMQPPATPTNPQPFLDPGKFDGKSAVPAGKK
jgi:pilus assembly protein CpaC